jgi:hypothetical protein
VACLPVTEFLLMFLQVALRIRLPMMKPRYDGMN